MRVGPSRRHLLRLLAGAAALTPATVRPQDAARDQGVAGTGMMRTDPPRDGAPGGPDEGDRGIGGTGVIGTIRGFGSILVNGLRIAYPADAAVTVDGEPARADDLKVGQVVRVVAHPVARGGSGGLATWRIDVTSEVVGPVERARSGRIVVLGQRVSTEGLTGDWAPGTRVAVSGLRRPDGVIVASLIEPRAGGPERVAGPVRRGADGAPMIGDLRLTGADAPPPGGRALVTGSAAAGTLRVTNAAGLALPAGLRAASIEAYVGRAGSGLALGSGIAVAGPAGPSVPRRGSVHAVLSARVAPDGALTVERLRVEGRPSTPEPAEPRERPSDGAPRFERERDRLNLRGLPDERSGPGGSADGGPGPAIDTRPGGDVPGPEPDAAGPRGGFGAPPGGSLRPSGGGNPGGGFPGGGLPGGGPGGPPGFGGPGRGR